MAWHRSNETSRRLHYIPGYGQRSCEPRKQAEHMAAPTQACEVKKVLANPEPSTHGTGPPNENVRIKVFERASRGSVANGGLLLLTRRVKSRRVYAEIDWSLLLMFAGLFIIVAGAQHALLSPDIIATVARLHLDQVPVLSTVTAVLSNLVSNVPAVLMRSRASLRTPAKM